MEEHSGNSMDKSSKRRAVFNLFRRIYPGILLHSVTIGLLVAGLVNNSMNLGYKLQWYRIPGYVVTWDESGISVGLLIRGLGVALKISVFGLLLSIFFGLLAAMLKLSKFFRRQSRFTDLYQIHTQHTASDSVVVHLFRDRSCLSPQSFFFGCPGIGVI